MRNETQSAYFSGSLEACLIDRFGEHLVHGYSRCFAEFTDAAKSAGEVGSVLLNDAEVYASYLAKPR